MNRYIVSLNNNVLRITYLNPSSGEFRGITQQISPEIVDDTGIIDISGFCGVFAECLAKLVEKKGKDTALVFLVSPEDCLLKFISTNKKTELLDEVLLEDVKSNIPDFSADQYYYSYQKIAPFVYQFVGIKKDRMNSFLEVATTLGASVESIVPWVMLLPKYLDSVEPFIFVSQTDNEQVVVLSEFNSVYFTGVYEEGKSLEQLQDLVKDLSVYKRVKPINKIYTLNYEVFSLDPTYSVSAFNFDRPAGLDSGEYDVHVLYEDLVRMDPDLYGSQLNLLNLLPVPVTQSGQKVLIYAGVGTALLITLVSGAFFVSSYRSGIEDKTPIASAPEAGGTVVLSESSPAAEVASETEESSAEGEEVVSEELLRSDLSIRVENGVGKAGVAATARNYLSALGYNVVSIGDADEIESGKTLVKFKTSKLEYRDLLISDMESDYATTVEEGLDDDSAYDVLVVLREE